MKRRSKRMQDIEKQLDTNRVYGVDDAVEQLKKCPGVKFDQSVNVSMKLGVDQKKSDQQVRGTVSLPHGTGKKVVIVVFCKGDKVQEALDAGADFAGHEELFEKVKEGWVAFDAAIATPELMRDLGKLAKILGPRGLMPSPKAGTVTTDVAKAVKEVKAGKVEFKLDKGNVVNLAVGKLSFDTSKLSENFKTLVQAVVRSRPPTAKGIFLQSLVLSSTMGPGLKIDLSAFTAAS